MGNETKGILYRAMTMENRKKFIRHRERSTSIYDMEEFNNLTAYIASDECVSNLRSLIERDYTMPPPYHYRVVKNLSARKRLSLTYKEPFLLKYSSDILTAVSTLTTIVILYTSLKSGLTSEDYLTFTASFALIITVVSSLTDIMKSMVLIGFLGRNVAPILQTDNEESEALEYVRSLQGAIRVEDVHFSYTDDSRGCLKGISVNIREGEKVAIVGESGCGKSTLLKILLGMEIPSAGTVYYDGKALQSLNIKGLRRCIGSVFQFSRLFPGTIADNIAFGDETAEDAKIWEAADQAEIGDYIRTLPLKMETEISESNSSGFSRGTASKNSSCQGTPFASEDFNIG